MVEHERGLLGASVFAVVDGELRGRQVKVPVRASWIRYFEENIRNYYARKIVSMVPLVLSAAP
jgi:hypothetical protein